MGAFAKRIYILKNGTTYSAPIYSTTGECGLSYMNAKVDNQAAYIPLCDTRSVDATLGRVTRSGTTYAIGNVTKPTYAYQAFTASGTFTVPSGVTTLRVSCVGGGAGGTTGYVPSGTGTVTFATGGGATSVGSVVASGATNPSVTLSSGSVTSYEVSKGTNNGGYYYGSTSGHGGGGSLTLTTITGVSAVSGGGGGYCDENTGGRVNFSGANGFRTVQTLTVYAGQVLTVTIGKAGAYWGRGGLHPSYNANSKGYGGSSGGAGCALIEWGGDI